MDDKTQSQINTDTETYRRNRAQVVQAARMQQAMPAPSEWRNLMVETPAPKTNDARDWLKKVEDSPAKSDRTREALSIERKRYSDLYLPTPPPIEETLRSFAASAVEARRSAGVVKRPSVDSGTVEWFSRDAVTASEIIAAIEFDE